MNGMIFFIFLCEVVFSFFLQDTALAETTQPPPLSVAEAVDIALAQHPTIAVGQATIEAARQRVWQQEAGYLPQGRYAYTYSRQ